MFSLNFIEFVSKEIQKRWKCESLTVLIYTCLLNIPIKFQTTSNLIEALILVKKLGKKYPNASGQPGCGFRLFYVAFILTCRFFDYDFWASNSKIFDAQELERMVTEFVKFSGPFCVKKHEVSYYLDVFENGNQNVPSILSESGLDCLVPLIN